MNKKPVIITVGLLIVILGGIGVYLRYPASVPSEPLPDQPTSTNRPTEEIKTMENIIITINGQRLTVNLVQNSATATLVEKLKQGNITVKTHSYGGFEQVGALGFSLPTSDEEIITQPGDIMLYQGNQITIFYGSNSWSYTPLGKITDTSKLNELLNHENVTLELSLGA